MAKRELASMIGAIDRAERVMTIKQAVAAVWAAAAYCRERRKRRLSYRIAERLGLLYPPSYEPLPPAEPTRFDGTPRERLSRRRAAELAAAVKGALRTPKPVILSWATYRDPGLCTVEETKTHYEIIACERLEGCPRHIADTVTLYATELLLPEPGERLWSARWAYRRGREIYIEDGVIRLHRGVYTHGATARHAREASTALPVIIAPRRRWNTPSESQANLDAVANILNGLARRATGSRAPSVMVTIDDARAVGMSEEGIRHWHVNRNMYPFAKWRPTVSELLTSDCDPYTFAACVHAARRERAFYAEEETATT